MLHENPFMADIDVDHWRNLQNLILESAKEKRRIILIHENGELLKFVHSGRAAIVRNIDRITDPLKDAEKVYQANAANVDFVQVLERRAVERFFLQVQDSWKIDEDLDEYVHRMFATVDEYPQGIVTYPGSARTNLGLQWRVGASYEDIKAAVEQFIEPATSAIFGVFNDKSLWTSLILAFDADRRITLVTTADPSQLAAKDSWQSAAKELTEWADRKYAPCSLALFMDLDSARFFLSSADKLAALREIAESGKLVADPAPDVLRFSLAAV